MVWFGSGRKRLISIAILLLSTMSPDAVTAQQHSPLEETLPWVQLEFGRVNVSTADGKRDRTYQAWVRDHSHVAEYIGWYSRSLQAFPWTVETDAYGRRRVVRPMHVFIGRCGTDGAYYASREGRVYICNEFVYNTLDEIHAVSPSWDYDRGTTENVLYFVLMHELAHALIINRGLPIVGNDEAAADEFATLFFSRPNYGPAIDAAKWLDALAQMRRQPRWDEHPVDRERADSVRCLLFAANPKRFAYLVRDPSYSFTPEVASRCLGRRARAVASWHQLIAHSATDVFARYLF